MYFCLFSNLHCYYFIIFPQVLDRVYAQSAYYSGRQASGWAAVIVSLCLFVIWSNMFILKSSQQIHVVSLEPYHPDIRPVRLPWVQEGGRVGMDKGWNQESGILDNNDDNDNNDDYNTNTNKQNINTNNNNNRAVTQSDS